MPHKTDVRDETHVADEADGFRATLVLARRDGGWKIIPKNNSVPMKMDGSNLAALDLKP